MLSDVDKARVLILTGHKDAQRVGESKVGRTSFFAGLEPETRYNALKTWQKEREESLTSQENPQHSPVNDSQSIPKKQLWRVFLCQAAPMAGFGFADNFLMISFGETIDANFSLYVSTMAAAGLGNLCSNIVGLGLADWIEHASTKMGIPAPELSVAQREAPLVRGIAFAGTACGVTLGCLLGLCPLMLWSKEEVLNHEDARN